MRIVELTQGSPEWLEFRAGRNTASDAAAVFGAHKYMSRDDLLHRKATGEVPEVTPQQQRIYDRGHSIEAQARPFAEKIIGQELFPCTVEDDNQWMAASMDGLTMLGDMGWEAKSLNNELRNIERAEDLDDHYKWQMDQQMAVSGAERILFTASDGTEEGSIHLWYERDEDRIDRLIDGWKQLEYDLAEYQPREKKAEAVAAPQDSLPALTVDVSGEIAITDNLQRFGDALQVYVERINLEPHTDQDFADLDAACKTLKDAEQELTGGEERALARVDSIQTLRDTIGQYRELARSTRLRAEKVVKAEKENRKNAIIREAEDALRDDIAAANDEFRPVCVTGIKADFRGAAKNKRTLESIESACNDELARARIELTRNRDHIRQSLKIIEAGAGEYMALFHDRQQLVELDHDHLKLVVRQRVDEHKAAEQRRIDEAAERKAKEEQAKREREEQAARAPEKPQEQRQAKPSDDAKQPEAKQERQQASGNMTDYEVTCTFRVSVPPRATAGIVEKQLTDRLREAGFQSLQSVEAHRVSEKQEDAA